MGAFVILVLGDAGTGKSTSIGRVDGLGIKGVNPDESVLIKCRDKALPFPSGFTMFKGTYGKGGNLAVTDDTEIVRQLLLLTGKDTKVRNVIVDDLNYLMTNAYMRDKNVNAFKRYDKIGDQMHELLTSDSLMREDQRLIFMSHSELGEDGRYKMMTLGKFLNEREKIPGLYTFTLFTKEVIDPETGRFVFKFVTGMDADDNGNRIPARTPYGMFEDLYIPNDMGYVLEKIDAYYEKFNPKDGGKAQ